MSEREHRDDDDPMAWAKGIDWDTSELPDLTPDDGPEALFTDRDPNRQRKKPPIGGMFTRTPRPR